MFLEKRRKKDENSKINFPAVSSSIAEVTYKEQQAIVNENEHNCKTQVLGPECIWEGRETEDNSSADLTYPNFPISKVFGRTIRRRVLQIELKMDNENYLIGDMISTCDRTSNFILNAVD